MAHSSDAATVVMLKPIIRFNFSPMYENMNPAPIVEIIAAKEVVAMLGS